MPKLKITGVVCMIGRSKTIISKEKINGVEIKLSKKDHICINIDEDGDIVLTSNSQKNIVVLSNDENQLVINLKK